MFSLKGKTAIVTGSGSGIGRSIAKVFAKSGARVAVVDINESSASETVCLIQEDGGAATAYMLDVTDPSAVDNVFTEIASDNDPPDILVNNAAIAHIGTATDTSPGELEKIYRVNIAGTHNCLRAGLTHMVKHGGGAILNMASIASLIGLKDRFAYSMSKGAVLTMTYSVAIDYIDQGIRCNCICPARVHTPFVDGYLKANFPGEEQAMFEKLSAYQPIGRMAKPEEIASLALYLCSDEASFLTGCAYPIDGGVLHAS